jgi:hypothetical protein
MMESFACLFVPRKDGAVLFRDAFEGMRVVERDVFCRSMM